MSEEHVLYIGSRDAALRFAAERIRRECAKGNIGEAVLILREWPHPDDRDALEAMLLDEAVEEPSRLGPMSHKGQAMVEAALVLPLLLLVIVGGLMLGLAMFDRSTLTYAAQEGAQAAAEASTDPERCDAARAAVEAVTGRYFGSCPDPERMTVTVVEGDPRAVRVRLDGSTYPVPFLAPVTVAGEAGALIGSPEPSPSEEPTP